MDGGGMGSRTPDLLNAIQTLYQLSYTPERDVKMISKLVVACQIKRHANRQDFGFVSKSLFFVLVVYLKGCLEKSQFVSGAFAP